MKMKVVGMDPSLSNFGLAFATLDLDTMTFTVDDLKVVKTEPEQDKKKRKVVRKNSEDLERAKLLHKGAMDATQGAYMAFIEVPVGSQSARAMASYGASIAVCAAVALALPMIQVTPTEVKMAGFGKKTATKEEMIDAMMAKYPNAPWPMQTQKGVTTVVAGKAEHMADAVAAIEAGIATDEFRHTMAMLRSSPLFKKMLLAA
jgi:Holliday junction resolvasome RuvABC endonuclease subunit